MWDIEKKQAGLRLRAIRHALGYETIREFAVTTKVHEDALGTWENGKVWVPQYFVRKLKHRYGVTFDWIYDGDPSGLPRLLNDAVNPLELQS